MSTSPVLLEAKKWSDLTDVIKEYGTIVSEGDGVGRLFGYASLVTNHDNEKPPSSEGIPNENATLRGMVLGMNVLAAGENELRGTRGTYIDEQGKERKFANVGVYAGLEPATERDGEKNYTQGMNITVRQEDLRDSLKSYIQRELGDPPKGVTLDDLFDNPDKVRALLQGTPEDNFGMYKFQVAKVETTKDGKAVRVPAIMVSTNEESKFAAIGRDPLEIAQMILDGQGYVRTAGTSTLGGTALDYFQKNVVDVANNLGLDQPRVKEIAAAVKKLSAVYTQAHEAVSGLGDRSLASLAGELEISPRALSPYEQARYAAIPTIISGVSSPYFKQGENVNPRDPVSPGDLARPENQRMPHTADEKFAAIVARHDKGPSR